jgi:RNA polymerase sigma-70 factor (ECF subfamily)
VFDVVTRQHRPDHTPLADLPDSDLVDAMATGDVHALEVLYDRYNRAVFSFALRMLGDREHAEEILQEVFLRAWRQAERFSEGRGTFMTWLLSITHNMAIDEIRRLNRRPRKAESSDPVLMLANVRDENPSVEEQALLGQTRVVVKEAMAHLPEAQRTAIELAYFRGMTQREIAEHLQEPLGTIKTRMRLALRKLREHMEAQGLDLT